MKLSFLSLFIFGLWLGCASSVFAAKINISEPSKSTLTDYHDEYQVRVDLSINVADNTNYFLRGVFYQTGSTNYCGITWNGSTWFSGPYSSSEGWKNFLSVSISSLSASTILKAKLDPNDNGCKNSGSYNFKIERFTQSGSGTYDDQNEQSLVVTLPTTTPTLIPTSTPNPTSILTSTPKPTTTPYSVTKPTSFPTKLPVRITPRVYGEDNLLGTSSGGVVRAASDTKNSPSPAVKIMSQNENNDNLAKILISLGGVMILSAAIWIGIMIKKKP